MGCGGSTSYAFVQDSGSSDKEQLIPVSNGHSAFNETSQKEEQAKQQNLARQQEEARQQELARQQEQARRQEEARQQEQARQQEAAWQQELTRQQNQVAEDENRAEQTLLGDDEQPQDQTTPLALLTQQPENPSPVESRTFTPLGIAEHNAKVGWVEWIVYKGKVYDGNLFVVHFTEYMKQRPAILRDRAARRVEQGEDAEETEFVTYYRFDDFLHTMSIEMIRVWPNNGVNVIRRMGISEEELHLMMPLYEIGVITGRSGSAFWQQFRADTIQLLDELQKSKEPEDCEQGVKDYLPTLVRWKERYGSEDPPERPPPSDGLNPNTKSFPLPADVDPDSLRLWVVGFEFDTELPPEGAWSIMPALPLCDSAEDEHEMFTASLRADVCPESDMMVFDIEGDAAWEVLTDCAIKDDVMTEGQLRVQTAREKRTDLNDKDRIRRRREKLADYFITEREVPAAVVMAFMGWADVMEQNMADLEKLCAQ